MALHGTLGDFSVADIFQLVGQQKKSGVLVVKDSQFEVRASFAGGLIVRTGLMDIVSGRDALEDILLRTRNITEDGAENAREAAGNTLRTYERAVLDARLMEKSILVDYVKLRNEEALSRLFAMKEANYEFLPGNVSIDPDLDNPENADSVLLEAMRTLDEWPAVTARIMYYNTRFQKGRDSGSFEEIAQKKGFNDYEKHIWQFFNEQPDRDVQNFIDSSMLGEFETCRSLYVLCEAGLLVPVFPKKGVRIGTSSGAFASYSPVPLAIRIGLFVMLTLTLVSLAAVLIVSAWREYYPDNRGNDSDVLAGWAIKESLAGAERRRLDLAIETWRLQHGSYPDGLQVLVEKGYLSKRDLHYPWKLPYIYRPEENSYMLLDPLY